MAQLPSPSPDFSELLRSVARSFHVSIRLLPDPLRRPIGVVYLLARTSDTLADSPGLSADERRDLLEIWSSAVEGRLAGSAAGVRIASGLPTVASQEERALIDALPQCLAWLEELPNVTDDQTVTVGETVKLVSPDVQCRGQ